MDRMKIKMLEIYEPVSGLDWMNYKLNKDNLTYHHIKSRASGGKRNVRNGALLVDTAHQYLHLIQSHDIETYEMLNNLFRIVNNQRSEPTYEQRQAVEYLLREFERVHRWDKGRKGKLLLQRKYLKRGFI